MKKLKRFVAFTLLLCMAVSLLPPVQFVDAAKVTVRYELDTDGIDPGASYLIVNTRSAGSANALRFYYGGTNNRDFQNQAVTVKSENGIICIDGGFTNEENCQFQFTGASAGRITHGNYSVNLSDENYVEGNPENTLTFTHAGSGQYRISYSSWIFTTYLRYNNGWGKVTGVNSSVYLFKRVEYVVGYDVTFDPNGATTGEVPASEIDLDPGAEYTLPKPSADLRKDIGEDTWLFLCWNTKADGSGTEYRPGDKITVTEDITLYADWYQQTKYTISMITYLNGVPTDVSKFAGYDRHFYAQLEGGDGTLIPMTRREEGTYSAKVVDNGTYIIYAQTISGSFEPVHGHKIVVYNQAGVTECMHYSITYNTDGGVWAEGEDPGVGRSHDGEVVYASINTPTKDGYRFVGWQYQDKVIQPGHPLTESAKEEIVVTALWEKLITVIVNVEIDHKTGLNGYDQDQSTMHNVSFTLLREENGVNLPVAEKSLELVDDAYNDQTKVTTYQVVFENMPKGIYHVASAKTHYETSTTYPDSGSEEQTVIDVCLKYTPDNFDLNFDVVVNTESDAEKSLQPKAVNVKVSYWGFDDKNDLGWHIITQQAGNNVPTTVTIGEDGKGSGFFPVWNNWSGSNHAYEYRVEVTSFVLPDGTVVPASGNEVIYTPNGSGLYTAKVSIAGNGRVPTHPMNSDTELSGAYFDGNQQIGVPTVTVDINPMTVTFDAGNGKVNGAKQIVLENQYRYPALHDYVAVPDATDKVFICWLDENDNPAENLEDQLLTGNVTYKARYNENITLSGTVSADAVYTHDNETAKIPESDRVEKTWVVLQKKVGDAYNDVDTVEVNLVYQQVDGYEHLVGLGEYEFKNLPNDGTEYRVHTLVRNYTSKYDNNNDKNYTVEETVAQIDTLQAVAEVNVHLDLAPDTYEQAIFVNASQIQEGMRPTGALAQILYRDLGDVLPYNVISQHTVPPYGLMTELDPKTATGTGYEFVWNWHTEGTPYEYQVQLTKLFGQVKGAYTAEGTAYTEDSPYTVVYGAPNNFLKQNLEGGVMLEATLVPKKYPVHLDLNLEGDTTTPILGLEEYMVDDGTGNDRYVYVHTWSFADQFTAYPYREGYVFKGWDTPDEDKAYMKEDGTIYVGADLDHEITLVAQWKKLEGTDYTIRHLELNTDKVLQGATVVEDAVLWDTVAAAEKAAKLDGYVYAGAMVNGIYLDKSDNPAMTVTDDPVKNLMIIYYLPDGSDGYTEQVESNIEINKTAILEKDGTYTIKMDTWTKDNPITTLIQQDTPLDIVLVLDQSGSLAANNYAYLNALQDALNNFVEVVADHGRRNEVDHRIAMVGYAGNASDGHSSDPVKATGGKTSDSWINTGVFDSNGEYHLYNVKGFNYTELKDTSSMVPGGEYYTKIGGENGEKARYLFLRYHSEYHHLISEDDARVAELHGEQVYGYVYNEQGVGGFVELTRNSSGLWLYGNKKLYSEKKFFTYHTDVWTHRDGVEPRQIHAYGVGAAYTPTDGHEGVYTREETTGSSFEQSIYKDALVPVSVGAAGSGGTNPGLLKATQSLGADGATRASYGMEMANKILEENPLINGDGRVRMVVMFTDGEPGYLGFDSSQNSSTTDYYQQAVDEANSAISHAYEAKNTYSAHVYTIGLYKSAGVNATSEVAYYMNALSSNYLKAKDMDDIKGEATYSVVTGNNVALKDNNGHYVLHDGQYCIVKYGYINWQYRWYYTANNTNYSITTTRNPRISSGKVNGFTIYEMKAGAAYDTPDNTGYYATTESSQHLRQYFEDVLKDITTKITTEIVLHDDTILRDIMGQGLVLTPGSKITAYRQKGEMQEDGSVKWGEKLGEDLIYVASVEVPQEMPGKLFSAERTTMTYTRDDGTVVTKENVPYIQVYNLDAENPTNPNDPNHAYHPHTIDITGYEFNDWYIDEDHDGWKMVVEVTRVEARDDVKWGVSTKTNNDQSGLWLPADEQENRELLLPFDQPNTIFVERAYVLDYGKEFTLSGWYFDDENGKDATPVHVDCNIEDGMNYFDPSQPNRQNTKDGVYGNTKYGNVQVNKDTGTVTYSPTTMNWGGYDQFYVFGKTWRKTVVAQNANANGIPEDINMANLWNKVTVIPANNIYYEDSFVTKTLENQGNDIDGFVFDANWEIVYDNGAENAGQNTEKPENMEDAPYGSVHGWTDSLGDDKHYTDGSAHAAGLKSLENRVGAMTQFTFTGTGVDVFSRTNSDVGMVVAILYQNVQNNDGTQTKQMVEGQVVDNLSVSGDYYHIPTISFEVPYGTYTVELRATMASQAATGDARYEYYLDGVRIYNPLGNTTNYYKDRVKEAYGLENNAVFQEVRDILLQYDDFNTDQLTGNDSRTGAVFVDWIREGQGESDDRPGEGTVTYKTGTFKKYGPKNEVYLSAGQAIVLKVAEGNDYYMGLKSLTGAEVIANVSGIDQAEPTAIKLNHTTDLYYKVTPVNGYIVLQNGNTDDALLSITNLRTTNMTKVAQDGGVLPITDQEAVQLVTGFADYLLNKPEEETLLPQPEEQLPTPEEQAQANQQQAVVLFTAVRQWLNEN